MLALYHSGATPVWDNNLPPASSLLVRHVGLTEANGTRRPHPGNIISTSAAVYAPKNKSLFRAEPRLSKTESRIKTRKVSKGPAGPGFT